MITQKQHETRMAQERQVVRHLIRTAKKHGYAVTKVDDGGDDFVKCTTETKAMDAVFSVDEATIIFKHPDQPKAHCACIVLGNSGPECIADASEGDTWDDVMKVMWDYCEKMEEA